MRRRILLVLLVAAAPLVWWWPREETLVADAPPGAASGEYGEPVPAVELAATAAAPEGPFVERWVLAYPAMLPPSHRLTLDIGAVVAGTAPARLASAGGDPDRLLDRAAVVLFDDPARRPPAAPVRALDLRLDLLGEGLSQGHGAVGSMVIAGAFATEPAGGWRAYRVTFGPGGPQCFLGLHPEGRLAVLLSRSAADGPEILARLRALVLPPGT